MAILMVLVGHAFSNYYVEGPNVLKWGGAGGVGLFLVLSGYGLTSSFEKNGLGVNFIKKRISTVLIPFWITGILKAIFCFAIIRIPWDNVNGKYQVPC